MEFAEGGGEDALEAGDVGLVEGGEVEAVQVEDGPDGAVGVEAGQDDFGPVAGVAGDVVLAQVADVTDDEGLAFAPGIFIPAFSNATFPGSLSPL